MGVLTVRGRVFLLGGVLVALAGTVLGLADLTKVGVLLVLLPLAAALLARRDLDVEITRTVSPRRVAVDEHADVTLEVRNLEGRRTPVVRAEEQLAYALGDRPRMILPRIEAGGTRGLTYRVRSHVRGRHPLGPLTIRVADPFGLAERARTYRGDARLTVLPRVEPLTPAPDSRAGSGGESTRSHRVSLVGEDDPSVREYRVGDDLRRIHWPSTARTGDMMVRQDEEPGHRRALVAVDDRRVAHGGSGTGGSLEWAVTAAASLVTRLFADGYEVHLATVSGSSGSSAPMETLDHALDVLAGLEAHGESRTGALDEAVSDFRSGGGGLVVAVVGALEREQVDRLGGGSRSVALVLDAGAFGDGREEESVARTVDQLAQHGWRSVRVGPGLRVADAWSRATARTVAA